MADISFTHPEPPPASSRVWPVFLPFAGCPYRCLFCAQDKQTGQGTAELASIFRDLELDLEQARVAGRGPYELAFYGGTFTALPVPWPERFLGLAVRFREQGLVTRVRCSTRPDCVDAALLSRLKAQGLDMVELGVQSFDDAILRASGRGYDGVTARRGCMAVQESGMGLGIQLLPGLPGDRPGVFQEDARLAAALKPEVARLYPCLVIRGTPLAAMWEQGDYAPWTLDRTREELALGLLSLWDTGVRVIRLGLPPEGTLAEHILAGPWHPALGQSVRGLALLEIVRTQVENAGFTPTAMDVPRRYQGELFGHANELAEKYAALGLGAGAVRYVDSTVFTVR
ncbi:elongator complex protein 3 [Pseudodesulfovibrio sediminis]|uniref:Radical SAM protein n=1 Tax=Pseudodesulfovibrio sediminis TaxID=2810563 RepID=A0ABM7P8A3_9BACT|nr:radical SAM protein [Pseudodesulfovibrio sediminis]BCS89209.1 radical SAM protein [Pseudodesulfovibrio sediminis]